MEDGFIQKWGCLTRDSSQELLQSTNKWRALRGEDPIGWEGFIFEQPLGIIIIRFHFEPS